MTRVTEPLRAEHRGLLPHVADIKETADAVGVAPAPELRDRVDATLDFLTGHLVPHAKAEEAALYPVVARLLGGPLATATMTRDHVEVMRLTDALGAARRALDSDPTGAATLAELRRVLYGLHALVAVHFAKEEEVYLPLLDEGLPAADAAAMFEGMHEAAEAAH